MLSFRNCHEFSVFCDVGFFEASEKKRGVIVGWVLRASRYDLDCWESVEQILDNGGRQRQRQDDSVAGKESETVTGEIGDHPFYR